MIDIILKLVLFLAVSSLIIGLVQFVQVGVSALFIILGAGIRRLFTSDKSEWEVPAWLVIPQLFIFQAFGLSLTAKVAGLYFGWQWLYIIGSWAYYLTGIALVVDIACLFILALIHGKYDLLGA